MEPRQVYRALTDVGFGEYEARAYLALLQRAPANGYDVSRRSGVPRAKVYETLERLSARGAAVRVAAQDSDAQVYAPTDPEVLLANMLRETQEAFSRAGESLRLFRDRPHVAEVFWRVVSSHDLIARGRELAETALRTLHVALWPDEFEALLPHLKAAAARGVRMALVLYGAGRKAHTGIGELQALGVGAVQHGRSKMQAVAVLGRQFVLAADRQRCITGSIFSDDRVEGAYSWNPGVVMNAADLVNHEIYLERVLAQAGAQIRSVYGDELQNLDAFDSPEAECREII